jgi:hypothetical protein
LSDIFYREDQKSRVEENPRKKTCIHDTTCNCHIKTTEDKNEIK